ncbi:hypothetical protein LINPERHAP2_LOCUS2046, partial [Linum perenne]
MFFRYTLFNFETLSASPSSFSMIPPRSSICTSSLVSISLSISITYDVMNCPLPCENCS